MAETKNTDPMTDRQPEAAPLDLAALRQRESEATPAPWRAIGDHYASFVLHEMDRLVCSTHAADENPADEDRRNAALIVAVRNALPALLDRLERAERERDEARETLAKLGRIYELEGSAVTCSTCGLRKKPIGRSAPLEMANSLCDGDCPGYRSEPRPGSLWPGEKREEFGYS